MLYYIYLYMCCQNMTCRFPKCILLQVIIITVSRAIITMIFIIILHTCMPPICVNMCSASVPPLRCTVYMAFDDKIVFIYLVF